MLVCGSRAVTVTAVTSRRWRPGRGAVVATVTTTGEAGSSSVSAPHPSTLIAPLVTVGISTPR